MNKVLVFCVLLLFAAGAVMVFNTSSAEVMDRSLPNSTHYAIRKQLIYACFGVLSAVVVYRVGFSDVLKLSPFILFIITIALISVFIPGLGIARNGAKRWVGMNAIAVQPSEFVKYLVPLVFIERLTSIKNTKITFYKFIKVLVPLFIPIGLILMEPDNGSAAVIVCALIPLLIVSKIRFLYWLFPICLVICIGGIIAYQRPYVKMRISVYLHPELDKLGKGHQPYQAKIATGSGQLLGKGPGASLQKLTYLPEAQNDYIAAIFAEEFGFIGILFLIMIYMVISLCGTLIGIKSNSDEGLYIATFVTFLISLQVFLNLGVVSGLLPSKGVNLPFFSQGGSSLISNLMGFALLLSVCNCENKQNSNSGRRDRRACFSGSTSSFRIPTRRISGSIHRK